MRAPAILISLAIMLVLSSIAYSQWPVYYGYNRYRRGYPGYGWGGGGGFASTPMQGQMYGMAAVIRAQGQAAENYSQARINQEQARQAYLKNEQEWLKLRNDTREQHQARTLAKANDQREARDRWLSSRPSSLPPKLTADELDPISGVIHWPDLLQRPEFKDSRQRLDELFASRALTSAQTSGLASDIYQTARQMQDEMRQIINQVPPNDYIASRKFLDSLALEGRNAPHS